MADSKMNKMPKVIKAVHCVTASHKKSIILINSNVLLVWKAAMNHLADRAGGQCVNL